MAGANALAETTPSCEELLLTPDVAGLDEVDELSEGKFPVFVISSGKFAPPDFR